MSDKETPKNSEVVDETIPMPEPEPIPPTDESLVSKKGYKKFLKGNKDKA
jgi:hypothetical protein